MDFKKYLFYNIKVYMLVILSGSLLFGCTSYNISGKNFSTMDGALGYQKIMYKEQIEAVKSSQYFGGSIFINVPSDSLLTQPPFVTGDPDPALRNYFLTLYKQDFKAVKKAIEKSNMFDSVKVGQVDSSLNYSTKYGYRYLAVSKGDGSWIIHDLFLGVNRVARFPKNFSSRIHLLESIIREFGTIKNAEQLLSEYIPSNETFSFDEATGKGTLSVDGQGIQTRYWMLKKIADLTGAKKLHSGANKHLPEQLFTVLDEQIQDGLFTIKFDTNVASYY
ncbi:hypothetical protein CXF72_07230 [Psychromonas sp. MB-3u-54]|uniref:hypothetical protein n=1 Tax=Psychromonas sp. MB-3u-54 TaxID=2058319 RepID=UPI000C34190E|nr:hypothetical protein [Psychromonas sp. MB-3u-54]PKH03261.1 hypothetical protein CXF72_07230 [Psychromonas sp. MB-3u-54]